MNNEWRRGLLAVIAVTLTTSGCYRYVPAQAETTPAGTGVRVLVTRAGAEELATATSADIDSDAPLVDGTVAGIEGDDLLVRIPVGRRQEGFLTSNIEQFVRVPMGEIVSFRRREVNTLATGIAISGGVALIAGIIAVIAQPLMGEQQDPPIPPNEFSSGFTIFSVPIGR